MKIAALQEYRNRFFNQKEHCFLDWAVSEEIRAACWKNLADTLDRLISLGPDGTVDAATELLRGCIETFNDLDTGFICTIEREELCTILYEIGGLCGLDDKEDWVDPWRDW